jgi:hypothetical protein
MRASCAAAVLVALAAPAAVAQSAGRSGWVYGARVEVDSGNGRSFVLAILERVTPRFVRMDIASNATAAQTMSGAYMIADDADSSITNVVPSRRRAIVSRNQLLMHPVLGMRTMRHRYASVTVQDLGDGGLMLGHKTRHVRVKSTETVEVTAEGEACSRTFPQESEMWIAPDVDVQPISAAVVKHLGAAAQLAAIDEEYAAVRNKLPKGSPLKTISHTGLAGGSSGIANITSTMEVTQFGHGAIAESMFEIPRRMTIVDDRRRPQAHASATLDSLQRMMAHRSLERICAGATISKP